MNPKTYISEIRKITQEDAAKELNITRQHLNNTLNGIVPWSLRLAKRFQVWSHDIVKATDLLNLE